MEELYRHFILCDLGIYVLLLRGHLNVKYRLVKSHILPKVYALVNGLYVLVGITHVLLGAVLTEYAEFTGLIVELTDKLNTYLNTLPESSVRTKCAVTASLSACLLECGNSGGGSYTGRYVTRRGFGVTTRFSKLLNGGLKHVYIVSVKGFVIHGTDVYVGHLIYVYYRLG